MKRERELELTLRREDKGRSGYWVRDCRSGKRDEASVGRVVRVR